MRKRFLTLKITNIEGKEITARYRIPPADRYKTDLEGKSNDVEIFDALHTKLYDEEGKSIEREDVGHDEVVAAGLAYFSAVQDFQNGLTSGAEPAQLESLQI